MKDADGNDVEVFTAAEVEQQKKDALDTYQKEHPDQAPAIAQLQTDLEKAKTDLASAQAGAGDKDGTLAAVVKTLTEKIDKTSALALEARNAPTQEFKSELITLAAKADPTLKEKLEIAYRALSGMPEGTKEEVRARMEFALRGVSDSVAPSVFDGGVGHMGNRGSGGLSTGGVDESDNSKIMRNVLGITDDQAKKYAPAVGQPGYVAPK